MGGRRGAKKGRPDPRTRARDPGARRPWLLSQIRGYYIDAISRLPTAELRTTLAYGLFVGGHCYGPLHPIHNIIVNSVWFAAAFPFRRADPIQSNFFTSEGMRRLAHRSIDGLLASLRHHRPALSHDDALLHLCLSGACLRGGARADFVFSDAEAAAAAEAARHPKPAAFALFATSVLPAVERDVCSLLAGKRSLSSPDIVRLSAMLLPSPLPGDPPPQPSLPEHIRARVMRIITGRIENYRSWYQQFIDIANAALSKFAHRTGAHYHLHAVYGHSVIRAGDFGLAQYVHINFMAWPKVDDPSPAARAPVRFFAEAYNPPRANCSEEDITLCCMLMPAQPSPHFDGCYGCVINNVKIDHPDTEDYYSGHPFKRDETKNKGDCQSDIDVDFRFFDPDRDIYLVEFYGEIIARREAARSEFCSKYASVKADNPSDDEDTSDNEVTSDEDDIWIHPRICV